MNKQSTETLNYVINSSNENYIAKKGKIKSWYFITHMDKMFHIVQCNGAKEKKDINGPCGGAEQVSQQA